MLITIEDLRRFTVARNFISPTTLKRVFDKWGFVQADPIRAPARAQDLILRHRVKNYRAGDLERDYVKLGLEEDYVVAYGIVTKGVQALMHPRSESTAPADGAQPWSPDQKARARKLLEFVRDRGAVHPREVHDHFSHGKVRNYWGGSSNATTQLLDAMQYRGLLRVARRDGGIRVYTAHEHDPGPSDEVERHARIDALIDVVVRIYAPLTAKSLACYARRLRYAIPQWNGELTAAIKRAKQRLSYATVDGVAWYWPAEEDPACPGGQEAVRLLAPFDPVVHDRDRFELLWEWMYRFEAYTPAAIRKMGYYALPLLWRDRVIGWGNLSVKGGLLCSEFGYVDAQPRDPQFKRELAAELERVEVFLGLQA